jgi:hypothetical protein
VVIYQVALSASAQPFQGDANPSNVGQNGSGANNMQALQESPELPQLPSYTGKSKLMRGWVQQLENGRTTYQLLYVVKEAPLDVKDWYQNVFTAYQWSILHSGTQTVNATHKDGHVCTVIVNESTEPGYQTELKLYYNLAPSRQ